MIFGAFKSIKYGQEKIDVVDVIRDYRSYIKRVSENYILRDYVVVGDPTPEYTAFQLYGNPTLFWLIILLNESIIDPFHDWVKTQDAVYESAVQRYKKLGGIDQVLYHMDGDFVKYYDLVEFPEGSQTWYHKGDKRFQHVQHVGFLYPVSVYEDEEMRNDLRRVIKIIHPDDLERFLVDLSREIDRVNRSE